ncbi:hypothetical protein QQP08_012355 [Theobroma cacao]|nr:hypothetical protein QQP08_012355 [Theobroma cacao]
MLERLDLSHNGFVDSLPNELGTLSQLELLKLSENKFSGNISASLGSLSRLIERQMGGNVFSGEIPTELGFLSSLQIAMNLSFNNLTGSIPSELGKLALLEVLLNNNHLSGLVLLHRNKYNQPVLLLFGRQSLLASNFGLVYVINIMAKLYGSKMGFHLIYENLDRVIFRGVSQIEYPIKVAINVVENKDEML